MEWETTVPHSISYLRPAMPEIKSCFAEWQGVSVILLIAVATRVCPTLYGQIQGALIRCRHIQAPGGNYHAGSC